LLTPYCMMDNSSSFLPYQCWYSWNIHFSLSWLK
jgi:hypothetical protein